MLNCFLRTLILALLSFLLPTIAMAQISSGFGEGLNAVSNIKLDPHEELFLFPYYHSQSKNPTDALKQNELSYQFSFKISLYGEEGNSFNFGYTQKSFWQIYAKNVSRPFRETNYNPEFFYRLGGLIFYIDLGVEHESNGLEDPQSRSWDRLYLSTHYRTQTFKINFKTWYIYGEEEHGGDNPDNSERPYKMSTSMGYGQLDMAIKLGDLVIKGDGRFNFSSKKGWGQYQLLLRIGEFTYLSFLYSNGYGQSLRDYARSVESFGIGILMNP